MSYENYIEGRKNRFQRKADQRKEWAAKAQSRSETAHKASSDSFAGIVLGQPILIGHHSQRRHEKAVGRGDAKMAESASESQLADHHARKAEGYNIAMSKMEKPAFCARRIADAEALIRKLERKGRTDSWHYTNAKEKLEYWTAKLKAVAPNWVEEVKTAEQQRLDALNEIAAKGGYVFSPLYGWRKLLKVAKKSVRVARQLEESDSFSYPIDYVYEWAETKPETVNN